MMMFPGLHQLSDELVEFLWFCGFGCDESGQNIVEEDRRWPLKVFKGSSVVV